MFITDEDYTVVIGPDALKTLSQASPENRRNAELRAIEEISGYLRPVYDCNLTFAAEGEDRNAYIVMITVDIALYHLTASLPGKMGVDTRRPRYEQAIEWLKSVQDGTVTPDLPLVETASGSESFSAIFSSAPKLNHIW